MTNRNRQPGYIYMYTWCMYHSNTHTYTHIAHEELEGEIRNMNSSSMSTWSFSYAGSQCFAGVSSTQTTTTTKKIRIMIKNFLCVRWCNVSTMLACLKFTKQIWHLGHCPVSGFWQYTIGLELREVKGTIDQWALILTNIGDVGINVKYLPLLQKNCAVKNKKLAVNIKIAKISISHFKDKLTLVQ